MQVHAVPEDERAFDSSGRALPWGYQYGELVLPLLNVPKTLSTSYLLFNSATLNRKQPIEKGPFGKPTTRRSTTRSKTATPATREEKARTENREIQDDVFGRFKAELEDQRLRHQTAQQQQLPRAIPDPGPSARSQPNTGAPSNKQASDPDATTTAPPTTGDPTEVLIYGYASLHFPAALTYYETASRGRIYEDYDRSSSNISSLAYQQTLPSLPRSLPRTAIRKIKEYRGGNHWIKVTFDSARAAELACRESPHVIGGCRVFAELWRGVGPGRDAAISAGGGDAGVGSLREAPSARKSDAAEAAREFRSVPMRMHGSAASLFGGVASGFAESTSESDTLNGSMGEFGSSSTATTNGRNNNEDESQHAPTNLRHRDPFTSAHETADLRLHPSEPPQQAQQPPATAPPQKQRFLRIPTAKPITLHPASSALLPVPPWTARTFGALPVVGPLFFPSAQPGRSQQQIGSTEGERGGVIGSTIPRDEHGEFDWKGASLWWVVCWWIDWVFGTDLCGLRGED